MGKKKLQGADGMNFQMQLTIKGLSLIHIFFLCIVCPDYTHRRKKRLSDGAWGKMGAFSLSLIHI